MAFGRIFMSEQLRPWQSAGITHLFATSVVDAPNSENVSRETISAGSNDAPLDNASPSSRSTRPSYVLPQHEPGSNFQVMAQAPLNKTSQMTDDVHSFYQQRYLKIQCKAFSVWTYLELGQDMSQQPDVARREYLQQFLKAIGMPRGSVTFWPFALPSANKLVPFYDWFWKGVAAYDSRLVVVFGEHGMLRLSSPESMAIKNKFAPSSGLQVLPSLEQLKSMQSDSFLNHFLLLREYLCTFHG